MGPSRSDVPFLEAGPHRAVRPLSDDAAVGTARTGENPVRVPGRGSRPEARVSFGATFVAKVPSWKAENAKMTFHGKSKIQSPRKETVWIQFPEEKEELDGAALHSRPRSGCGSGSSNYGRHEQPEKAADLRPLG